MPVCSCQLQRKCPSHQRIIASADTSPVDFNPMESFPNRGPAFPSVCWYGIINEVILFQKQRQVSLGSGVRNPVYPKSSPPYKISYARTMIAKWPYGFLIFQIVADGCLMAQVRYSEISTFVDDVLEIPCGCRDERLSQPVKQQTSKEQPVQLAISHWESPCIPVQFLRKHH